MDFTITEPDFSSPWPSMLMVSIPAALILGFLLFRWLRKSPLDARDVLHAAPIAPVSDFDRRLDIATLAVSAAALLLPMITGMQVLYALLFLDPFAWMRVPGEHVASAGFRLDLLPREAVLVSLVACAGVVLWLQLRGSKRDVLGVSTRT
jgi:hypothetical protein